MKVKTVFFIILGIILALFVINTSFYIGRTIGRTIGWQQAQHYYNSFFTFPCVVDYFQQVNSSYVINQYFNVSEKDIDDYCNAHTWSNYEGYYGSPVEKRK